MRRRHCIWQCMTSGDRDSSSGESRASISPTVALLILVNICLHASPAMPHVPRSRGQTFDRDTCSACVAAPCRTSHRTSRRRPISTHLCDHRHGQCLQTIPEEGRKGEKGRRRTERGVGGGLRRERTRCTLIGTYSCHTQHNTHAPGRIDSFPRERTRRVEQYLVSNNVVRVDAELGKLLHQPLRLVERQKLLRKRERQREREREREREKERELERTKDAPAS